MARVGILGGSFNPIHNGHLHLAEAALRALSLDRLVLMPAGEAPHKPCDGYAPAEDRLAMCRLACAGQPQLSVSRFELDKRGKSYTVETLRALQADAPTDAFFLLVGGDMLLSFTEWYCWQEILQRCTLVAISRGEADALLTEAADALRPYGEIRLLSVPPMVVSSTEIRMKIKFQQNYSCYLPENVVQYIRCHRLYAGADSEHKE